MGTKTMGAFLIIVAAFQTHPLPSEAEFKKAKEQLSSTPDDPDANKIVGKYTAFVLGDYFNALPHLSKSGDKVLKSIADHELDPEHTASNPQKVGMGDEWVLAAKANPPLARLFHDRAAYWYGQAWPLLD